MARYFDPEMLKVENLNYASEKTILFQRLSVIITDVVYAFGVRRWVPDCRFILRVIKYPRIPLSAASMP